MFDCTTLSSPSHHYSMSGEQWQGVGAGAGVSCTQEERRCHGIVCRSLAAPAPVALLTGAATSAANRRTRRPTALSLADERVSYLPCPYPGCPHYFLFAWQREEHNAKAHSRAAAEEACDSAAGAGGEVGVMGREAEYDRRYDTSAADDCQSVQQGGGDISGEGNGADASLGSKPVILVDAEGCFSERDKCIFELAGRQAEVGEGGCTAAARADCLPAGADQPAGGDQPARQPPDDDAVVVIDDEEDDLLCPFAGCGRVFAGQRALSEHIAALHAECPQCGVLVGDAAAVGAHLGAAHICTPGTPRCPVCDTEVVGGPEAVEAHLRERHTCSECRDFVGSDDQLDAHTAENHPASLECPQCHAGHSTSAQFRAHVELCLGNEHYPGDQPEQCCPVCNKGFQSLEALKEHAEDCTIRRSDRRRRALAADGEQDASHSRGSQPCRGATPSRKRRRTQQGSGQERAGTGVLLRARPAAGREAGDPGAVRHTTMTAETLRAELVPRGGELVLNAVLSADLAARRAKCGERWAALPDKARHAVEVLPAYLPSDGASRCACQLAAAEAKAGPGASRQCRCTASLAALLRDHGLRDPVGGILPGNLAAAVAAAGVCMLQRVPPEDEREGLRGQQCLVACRAFAAGDVILPYQGLMLTEHECTELKRSGVRLSSGELAFRREWRCYFDAYAHELRGYNTTLSEFDFTDDNKLAMHAFRCGNETSFANDPVINVHDVDFWDCDRLAAGKLEHAGLTSVSHAHPASRYGNVVLQEYLVCGWPFVFMTATADIGAGDEILLQYGYDYWSARMEDRPHH
eukprot:jgi/Tetstr1/439971/TSEL_003037.t1